MDEDEIGGNQRRKANQIYKKDDRTTIPRNDVVQAAADDDDEQLPLSLSLGPTSYPSQISPPLRLAPPPSLLDFSQPMMTRPSPDFISYQKYLMSSQPYLPSSMSNFSSSQQIQPPFRPPGNYFPQSAFAPLPPPSSNQKREPRRSSTRSSQFGNRIKNEKIPAPFPWATNIRGRIRSLEDLESNQITIITGDVQCKHCEKVYQVSYNLREKYSEVEDIFVNRKRIMRERAPAKWTNPVPARCELCGREKAVKPVIAERKSKINWLFLFLGQTLGYCTLEQLKNFCKHCKSHRTGAKDRVLYLTYLGLCKMLEPNRELFKREPLRR
ncbi:unnamed protein product [Arabis nemorensis]|uniref:DUF7086 domain-containing protein n=1 Tax=Arabis nemorensis TaxID=586526 RepID=A0A565BGX8_9BRAS|nr:unnamed protein product [Arabis nemorensis]